MNGTILQNVTPEELGEMIQQAIVKGIKQAIKPEDKYLSRMQLAEKLGVTLPTLDKRIKEKREKRNPQKEKIRFLESGGNLPDPNSGLICKVPRYGFLIES